MTDFKVRDRDCGARVRQSFGCQPFMAMIGAALRSDKVSQDLSDADETEEDAALENVAVKDGGHGPAA